MPLPTVRPPDPERLLSRLEWTVLRPLDGLLQGDYRTFFHGSGLDFADLREYQVGDDVRTIDWNATARLREPHVRRFHEDRDLDAWFLVDTSPSLDFGTERLKRDRVTDLVGTLATLLTRQGNRVGACLYDGGLPRLYPATSGRKTVLALMKALVEPATPQDPAETDLKVLIDAMAGVLRRRSMVFLVSDFHSRPGWEAALGWLTLRHEVLTFRVYDPHETDLPDLGTLWLQDAETGQQVLVDTGDRGFRRRLAELAVAREQTLAASFQKARVDTLSVSTADDLVRALLGLINRRRMKKNHSRGGRP